MTDKNTDVKHFTDQVPELESDFMAFTVPVFDQLNKIHDIGNRPE